MESVFFSELALSISNESVHFYTKMAYKHLKTYNTTLEVECTGKDKNGQLVFGICMRYDNGDEEWYDPSSGGQAVAGWINKDEAQRVLQSKVLPNFGYAIYQRDLQLFHQNMTYE